MGEITDKSVIDVLEESGEELSVKVQDSECTEMAQQEKEQNARPELRGSLPVLDEYDTIFVGYPIWLAYHNLIKCTQAFWVHFLLQQYNFC